jgi:phosphoribosylformylglycinamidine cyclo-ligase
MAGATSLYAKHGVDFSKEHEVVEIFKKLFEYTKPFTADLKDYGFEPPDKIGYFSDGVKVNVVTQLYRLLENQGALNSTVTHLPEIRTRKDLLDAALAGMDVSYVNLVAADGPGSKPEAHMLFRSLERSNLSDLNLATYLAEEAGLPRACTGICGTAMVSNDMNAGGARMAYLGDYVAWQNILLEFAMDIATGLYIGAKEAGCTVMGGENASLGGSIRGYDMCLFGQGLILNNRYVKEPITGQRIKKGDVIIGIRSNGLHCNGISTARKGGIMAPALQWLGLHPLDRELPELGHTMVEEILKPTYIYRHPIMALLEDEGVDVKAIDNVTGEGIENLKRPLENSEGMSAVIDIRKTTKLEPHAIFEMISKFPGMEDVEMWGDYNMGTGMRVIVDKNHADKAIKILERYKIYDDEVQAEVQGEIVDPTSSRYRTIKKPGQVKVLAKNFDHVF